MPKTKRIFIVGDMKEFSDKFLLSGIRKQVKGFIRLGHDVHRFSWGGGGYSEVLKAAIINAKNHGVLFVAAAGNSGTRIKQHFFCKLQKNDIKMDKIFVK